jgi:polyhydroxyalkanoate synthase
MLLYAYVAVCVLGVTGVITGLVYLAWRGHLSFWSRRLALAPLYAEVEEHTLPDGGMITLRRVARTADAERNAPSSRVPVLLVHGLAMSQHCFDLEQQSLTRYLEREGFDVWLLTLRSGRTYLSPFGPKQCDFAAMVSHDLPFAVDTILARTGHSQVDIAGLSMGGMLLYASLGRTLHQDKVRKVVVFGSPGHIRPLGPLNLSRFMPATLALSVPMRAFLRTVAFAPRLVPGLVWKRLYNPQNIESQFERRMLWNIWEGIPGRLGRDFVTWSARGGVISVNDAPILDGLAQVEVPALFFAGSIDWLAPVSSVRAAFDAWGNGLSMVEKRFVIMGRETSGATFDYGHCDLILGRNAEREVFAPAVAFLCEDEHRKVLHSSPSPKPDAAIAPLALQA